MTFDISAVELPRLIQQNWRMLDVRAPIEVQQMGIPGAVNLPILNDEEREKVGTCYKQVGREAAMELGQKLVSGSLREQRIHAWCELLRAKENTIIFCYRGGLRSKITQAWCREAGVHRPRIEEGYKGLRATLLKATEDFVSLGRLVIIGGTTGAGKTDLLRALPSSKNYLDLELYADHKGSAFGKSLQPQPSQTTFENQLAWSLIKNLENDFSGLQFVEDESRLIGRIVQPDRFFLKLRESPLLFVDESLESRTEQILKDYVIEPLAGGSSSNQNELFASWFLRLQTATKNISKRLGGVRTQEILLDLDRARLAYELAESSFLDSNRIWIRKLLEWYYDPLYLDSLAKRNPKILFRGSHSEVLKVAQEMCLARPDK